MCILYNSLQIIGERRSIVQVMYIGHWSTNTMRGVVKKQRANIWEAGFFRDKLLKLELACQNIFLPSGFLQETILVQKLKVPHLLTSVQVTI